MRGPRDKEPTDKRHLQRANQEAEPLTGLRVRRLKLAKLAYLGDKRLPQRSMSGLY